MTLAVVGKTGGRPRKATFLKASGAMINVRDRESIRHLIGTKQVWQTDAWIYRDLIPELRFACRFVANAIGRGKLLCAAVNDEGDDPILFAEKPDNVSAELQQAATEELSRLPLNSGAAFQGKIAENFDITGECWLHGYLDALGRERWEILSVDEVQIAPDGLILLKNGKGQIRHQVDPDTEDMLRLWIPHPRFSDFADSPMRALQDLCSEIVLNGRERRAVRRSRAAANGILLMPNSLSLLPATRDDEIQDPDADDFMAEFTAAMLSPINNEGEPGAVVPMVVRGEAEDLAQVKHITLQRDDSQVLLAAMSDALARLGTGLDLPPEVLSGIGQTNHWSGAQIDLNTYRYHIDPRFRNVVDSLTEGFLWPRLVARGQFDLDEISQVRVWFDAGNLTENPNRGADAQAAYDRAAIGARALRDALGFNDADAPNDDETFRQIMLKTGMDPATSALLLQRLLNPKEPLLYPTREQIADKTVGNVPVDSNGNPLPKQPGPPALPQTPAASPAQPGQPSANTPSTGGTPTSANTPAAAPSTAPPRPAGMSAQVAWALSVLFADDVRPGQVPLKCAVCGQPATETVDRGPGTDAVPCCDEHLKQANDTNPPGAGGIELDPSRVRYIQPISADGRPITVDMDAARRLTEIERALRDRLITAAEAAMERALEKAGARVRSHTNGRADLRCQLIGEPAEFAAILGEDAVMALGLSVAKLLEGAFATLKGKWSLWLGQAVNQLATAVLKLLHIDPRSTYGLQLRSRIESALNSRSNAGWARLETALQAVAQRRLFHPKDDQQPGESQAALVPPGAVRAALAEVGGMLPGSAADGRSTGGLVGDTVHAVVKEQGGSQLGFEWVYGITPMPRQFHPHERLDGVRFLTWTDEVLDTANDPEGAWVGPWFHPGDHDGCLCDYVAVWAIPEYRDQREGLQQDTDQITAERALAAGDTAAGREGTTAQAVIEERNRIQELQQRFIDRNQP